MTDYFRQATHRERLEYLAGTRFDVEQTYVVPITAELLSRAEWEATKPVYGEVSETEYLRGLLAAVGETGHG